MSKTIFITSFHVLISRNILSSPFFEILAADKDVRIVLLVPSRKKPFFEKEFASGQVIVEGVPRAPEKIDTRLGDLALSALSTKTLKRKRASGLGGAFWFLAPFLAHSWTRGIVRALDRALTPRDRFGGYFERYRPDLVITTDIFQPMDSRLIYEARERGIPTLGLIRSWDNPTSKGLLRVVPDRIAVANEILRRELSTLHGVPDNIITTVGIPHYDRYEIPSEFDRAEFLRSIGANPERRLVLFAPTGDRYLSRNTLDREIIELLSRSLPSTHQLLVRLPPSDSVNLDGFVTPPNVIIERPGVQLALDPAILKNNELSRADDEHLVRSLAASDLVVAGPTTLIIDAAIFDRPVILIAFDGTTARPYRESVARYYEYDHMEPVLSSGGARLAASEYELQILLTEYLRNPAKDRTERARLVAEQAGSRTGASARLHALVRACLDGAGRSRVRRGEQTSQ